MEYLVSIFIIQSSVMLGAITNSKKDKIANHPEKLSYAIANNIQTAVKTIINAINLFIPNPT